MEGFIDPKAAAYLAAAFAAGLGTLGPALAQGLVGAKACESVGKYPESAGNIRQLMVMALAFVETCSIYAVLISAIIIYFA